ncbi:MAG TPA: GNAT family N-acetyltransferase [Casimicrobiaceae bacterium]|jgi:ribosomal protein S18 acetylase RimI-like enzyme|nr:GNAT family N-acetyltransferase [Casimicrobiaceae bacterium]
MAARNIVIDFARPSDAQALSVMSRDLIEAGLGWVYRTERFSRLITNDDTVALVARANDRPVAFAVMEFGDERAHLVVLAVSPRYQRMGIARRLVLWQLKSALVAGVTSVHVELRADNEAAFAFYRALGFTETLRVPGYYRGRETAIRMIRMLRIPRVPALEWRPPPRDPH